MVFLLAFWNFSNKRERHLIKMNNSFRTMCLRGIDQQWPVHNQIFWDRSGQQQLFHLSEVLTNPHFSFLLLPLPLKDVVCSKMPLTFSISKKLLRWLQHYTFLQHPKKAQLTPAKNSHKVFLVGGHNFSILLAFKNSGQPPLSLSPSLKFHPRESHVQEKARKSFGIVSKKNML